MHIECHKTAFGKLATIVVDVATKVRIVAIRKAAAMKSTIAGNGLFL